jgi:hypothetical protein
MTRTALIDMAVREAIRARVLHVLLIERRNGSRIKLNRQAAREIANYLGRYWHSIVGNAA